MSQSCPATPSVDRDLLRAKLRHARLAHAEQLSAIDNVHGAAILRLEILKDELLPTLAANVRAREIVDVSLVSGYPPRLWIDMTSYVVMSPDPSTYSYRRDTLSGTDIVIETKAAADVRDAVLTQVASQLIKREKMLLATDKSHFHRGPALGGKNWIIYSWLCGFTTGACFFLALQSIRL